MLGLEKVLLQAASLSLATIVSKVLWEGGGKVLAWVGKGLDVKTEQAIAKASEQYIRNYSDRHGLIKVLGMREPVSLESVYTTVQFLDKWDIRQFESIETLEQAYRQNQERSFQPKEAVRQDGLRVANEKQFLMVLGGPGAGKSTFIRKMGLEALKGVQGGYEHACIPVLLELKQFTDNDINLEKAITQEFRICGFPEVEAVTQKLLERGNLLILLDGLDEVPTKNLSAAIAQIQDFVDRYDQNRFIASCRVAAYRHNFRRFTDVAMADFNPAQIKQFIFNWFHSEADQKAGTAQKCWKLLQKPEHRAAKELAQTPLLLTLLCLVYDRSQNFPHNRSVLYRKALRVLLEEWASEKRILQEEIYQGLSTELEEVLLSEIAYWGFEHDRLFFSQREVVEQIKTFLLGNLNAPRHLNGEAILEAIAIQQGILVERAEGVYSFSHLTLQEYLTAQYIDDQRRVGPLVIQHGSDQRWQEVFLLVAGLMRGGADDLLLALETQAQSCISTPKLQGLLQWADRLTQAIDSPLSGATRRATLLFLVLISDPALDLACLLNPGLTRVLQMARSLALARVPEFAHTLSRTPARTVIPVRALARALTEGLISELDKLKLSSSVNFKILALRLKELKAKAPDVRQPAAVHQDFVQRVAQVWFKALQLDAALINLSEAEFQALEQYFYIYWLLVRCKQTAVRLSPGTWQAIETRMLTVNLPG